MPQEEVFDFILYAALGVMIGGRLGYCILYNAHFCFHDPLEIFKVWHGGMASHGGIAGVVIAVCIYARQRHVRVLPLEDAVAVMAPWASCWAASPISSTENSGRGPLMFRGRSFSPMRPWWTATRPSQSDLRSRGSIEFWLFSLAGGCTGALLCRPDHCGRLCRLRHWPLHRRVLEGAGSGVSPSTGDG